MLTAIGHRVSRPLLYLFGASDTTYPYAASYLTVYSARHAMRDDVARTESVHKLSGLCRRSAC
ncbi:MAG: hypothetical protein ACLR4Z_07995 [Butyricicoccaceae bacterium]